MKTPFVHCLLIDDNPLDNFLNRLLILKNNFALETTSCESCEEALLKLADGTIQPDVIFVDLYMPVIDGFQFLNEYANLKIRKDNTKIFVLSGSLNQTELIRAENTPYVTKLIEKTLNPDKLREIIDAYYIHA